MGPPVIENGGEVKGWRLCLQPDLGAALGIADFFPSLFGGDSSGGCGRVGRYARRWLVATAWLVPFPLIFI